MHSNHERKIINVCQTCRTPIYEGEPIYTSSKGQSSGYNKGVYGGTGFFGNYQGGAYGGHHSSTHASETWAQCAWCYDQWQVEVAANKSFWIKWWIGGVILTIIATALTIYIWPGEDIIKGLIEDIPWYRWNIFNVGSLKIPLLAPHSFRSNYFPNRNFRGIFPARSGSIQSAKKAK